ncbi:OmpA family protein [Parvicella tangerina]|uniref:Outer membrane protein A n=1 Tax=Parvicella tangerina TaxID=2829795 RepID=A0A916JQL8_9FLAO|nr:OmpA family protein [Parvicella tangerina]CAG5086159.1 Outer membrane protein A [Parvicella tangerina]
MRFFLFISFTLVVAFANAIQEHDPPVGDTNVVDTLLTEAELLEKEFPEICPEEDYEHWVYNPAYHLTPDYYKERYNEKDLMYKIVDNWGNGYDSLYGARNMRPILHGVAYRGGANNYFHKEAKRSNHNPLPDDGIENLCQEGFSGSVYLYRKNWESAPPLKKCDCVNGAQNKMDYYQYDYFDDQHVYEMIELVYKSAVDSTRGPVYLHCWNGWHASGFISAVLLKQFCGFSDLEATAYWDLGTDGANTSPRYNHIRERIMNFEPISEFIVTDSLGNAICPPMPEFIDSSQLHISIEHLAIVPEAIPVGTTMILENVKFGPGKTSFSSPGSNEDIKNLLSALTKNPEMVIEISGHTDRSGSESTNKKLSKQRAQFVYNYLIDNGIAPERLSFKGLGSAKPAYSNKTKDGRAANRRIEVRIVSKKAESMNSLVDEGTLDDEEVLLPIGNVLPNLEVGKSTVLNGVVFGPGEIMLSDSAKLAVDELIEVLQANQNLKVELIGYTDISGMEEKNILLSNQRSQAVHDYIVSAGIAEDRVSFAGCGPINPIAPNAYRWGRDKNRRIEVKLLAK